MSTKERWLQSRTRIALLSLLAWDMLYGYIIREPGLFGTVWERLPIAAILLSMVWEAIGFRIYVRRARER